MGEIQTNPNSIKLIDSNLPKAIQEELALYHSYIQSGMLPKRIKTPQEALIIVRAGAEFKLSPIFSLGNAYVVNGTCTLNGRAMAIVAKANGFTWETVEDFTVIKQRGFDPNFDNRQTIIEMWHLNKPENKERARFTLGDALKGGISRHSGGATQGKTKDTWGKFPQYMIWWRCFSKICNRVGAVSALLHSELGVKEEDEETKDISYEEVQSAQGPVDRLQSNSVSDRRDDSETSSQYIEVPNSNDKGTTISTGSTPSKSKKGGNKTRVQEKN